MGIGVHSKGGERRWSTRVAVVATGVGAVVIVGVGTAYAASHHAAASGHHPSRLATAGSAPAPAPPPPPTPLRVVSVSPAGGTANVAANAPITVTFSAPVATGQPDPTVSPALPGTWTTSGSTMTFHPDGGFVPATSVTVTVPAGVRGAPRTNTVPLAAAVATAYTVAPGSILRLQELLAELGYLPLTFTSAATPSAPALGAEPTAANLVSSSPLLGAFTWRFPNVPASLQSTWQQGQDTVLLQGAVMAFESDHNLSTDGSAGPQVWATLLAAAAQRQVTTRPYDYLMISQSRPETLQVWSNGNIVASTLCNTGVPGAPTADGTFPVFSRFASTTMTGKNPDGSHYSDPGVQWVAYFNGGDAVHQFARPGYGYPQSDGCVELPSSSAQTVWGLDPIGTLVTVT